MRTTPAARDFRPAVTSQSLQRVLGLLALVVALSVPNARLVFFHFASTAQLYYLFYLVRLSSIRFLLAGPFSGELTHLRSREADLVLFCCCTAAPISFRVMVYRRGVP